MSAVLGILHGADYLVTHLLLGSFIFYEFVLPDGGVKATEYDIHRSRTFRRLASLALLTSALWMVLSVADMGESWVPSEIWTGMSTTGFGHLWCIRIGVLLAFVITVKRLLTSRVGRGVLLLMVFSLPIFSVSTGHAAAKTDRVLMRESLVLLHSIGVAVWTGGLLQLYGWLGLKPKVESASPEASRAVVTRFSHFAMVSTGVIGFTGLGMAYLGGISLFHPFATTYGALVSGKIALFTLALGGAAVNQFVHLRKWEPNRERDFALAIRREVRLEGILILFAFGVAGFLARTSM